MTNTQNLTDEITTWFAEQQKNGKLERRDYSTAFMLARDDIIDAIEAGYYLKTIWGHMHETGRIPFRYETFLRYVRKYITRP
jgi:hypothetical protein